MGVSVEHLGHGVVRPDVEVSDAGHALVAQIEGTLSLARNSQSPDDLSTGARGLRRYLDSMRTSGSLAQRPRAEAEILGDS
jgi:hypothetical protein